MCNELNDRIMLLFELKGFALIDKKKKKESAAIFLIP